MNFIPLVQCILYSTNRRRKEKFYFVEITAIAIEDAESHYLSYHPDGSMCMFIRKHYKNNGMHIIAQVHLWVSPLDIKRSVNLSLTQAVTQFARHSVGHSAIESFHQSIDFWQSVGESDGPFQNLSGSNSFSHIIHFSFHWSFIQLVSRLGSKYIRLLGR